MSLPLYCHGPVAWFENVPRVVVPALKDKMKYFLICEAATKLVLSRGTSLILPHQLSYTYSLSANMQAQGTPQSQSSIDREIDASVNFEQLPFGHFFVRFKKKNMLIYIGKRSFQRYLDFENQQKSETAVHVPSYQSSQTIVRSKKKRKKLSIFADLIPLVGGGGCPNPRTPPPSYAHDRVQNLYGEAGTNAFLTTWTRTRGPSCPVEHTSLTGSSGGLISSKLMGNVPYEKDKQGGSLPKTLWHNWPKKITL